jgi:hypothetical protein
MNTPPYIGNAQPDTDGCGGLFGTLFGVTPAYRVAPTKSEPPAPAPVPVPGTTPTPCPDPGKPPSNQDGTGLTAVVRISGGPVGAYVDAYGDTIVPVGKEPITIVFEPRG